MKIKLDFVTNSSSASFILFVESMEPDLSGFKQSLRRLFDWFILNESGFYSEIEGYRHDNKQRMDNILESVDQISTHCYKLEAYTSMLNSLLQDTPEIFVWMILESMAVGLKDYGINSVVLRIEDEAGGHYTDENCV